MQAPPEKWKGVAEPETTVDNTQGSRAGWVAKGEGEERKQKAVDEGFMLSRASEVIHSAVMCDVSSKRFDRSSSSAELMIKSGSVAIPCCASIVPRHALVLTGASNGNVRVYDWPLLGNEYPEGEGRLRWCLTRVPA